MKTKLINWASEAGYLLSEGKLTISKCGRTTIPETIDGWDIILLALAVYRKEHFKPKVPLYITACGLRIQPMHRQWFVAACRKYMSLKTLDMLPNGNIGGAIEVKV